MALKLNYTGETTIPVEIEGLTPDRIGTWPLADIERFEIFHGNEKTVLAEFFDVAGDASDGRIEFEGDLAGVHWIGAGMTEGQIHIAGNAGRHVGSEMSGGKIRVEGDAGGWVGAEMHGGRIDVRGNADHLVGAAYRGSAQGMTGGTILVSGDAGNEVGLTMRRGLIAIGGSCGDLAGFNMIAGSVFIFGESGIRHGAGMRRGTLAFFGAAPPILPSFKRGARYDPLYLRLAFVELKRLGFEVNGGPPQDLVTYHGDFIEGGRGEILVREPA